MNYRVQTLAGETVEPHTVIFPILKEITPHRTRLVGTGFFITSIGHFVTAKHVIQDVLDPKTRRQLHPLHALHFVVGAETLVRGITKVSLHDEVDLAVGKMDYHQVTATGEILTNRVPTFTTSVPPANSDLVTFAYPESDADFEGGQQSSFRPQFYSGKMLRASDVPRDRVLVNWPHYCTSIDMLGGASGGPVFDNQGRVCAINCVGGLKDLSYLSRVIDLVNMRVPDFPVSGAGVVVDPTVADLERVGQIAFNPPLA
ncbi:MAG TPA: serine protease [Gemmatimonadaceae bacterium]|jgi:hypothetical protein